MQWSEIAALIRRYAVEIAEGRIEARAVAEMTDDELKTFRKEKLSQFEATQAEAEQLAKDAAEEDKSDEK